MNTATMVNTTPGHFKFYSVNVTGQTMTVKFGRIGSQGQTLRRKFKSVKAAEEAAFKLIDTKVQRGYTALYHL